MSDERKNVTGEYDQMSTREQMTWDQVDWTDYWFLKVMEGEVMSDERII